MAAAGNHRTKVTLALDNEDVMRVQSSALSKGERAKFMEYPSAVYAMHPFDQVLSGGKLCGLSTWIGYTANEAVGKAVAELLIPQDRQAEEPAILARLCRGERVQHFETVRRCKDGRHLDISLTISPIRDASGAVQGASKIMRDISERRKLRERLDYLAWLGVDCLWVPPFMASPLRDGGYDVAHYREVDPKLGTLEHFDELIAALHAVGIRMFVDIVPNHSSDQHEWFQAALAAGPGSPERERYIFRSSTNAEDLPGFNGAGLYESVVVPGDASDEVEAAFARLRAFIAA